MNLGSNGGDTSARQPLSNGVWSVSLPAAAHVACTAVGYGPAVSLVLESARYQLWYRSLLKPLVGCDVAPSNSSMCLV
jgi:hypothetical protein